MEWAISQQVNIINFSYVLFNASTKLLDTLNAASKHGIAVICSTADEGYTTTQAWPATYNTSKALNNIFPVGASDENQKITSYSNEHLAAYLIQGENINVLTENESIDNKQRIVSGSSVATAMASGVASLAWACYMIMQDIQASNPQHHRQPQNIIKQIFEEMCPRELRQVSPRHMSPWEVFPTKERDHRAWEAKSPQAYTLGDQNQFKKWIENHFKKCVFRRPKEVV